MHPGFPDRQSMGRAHPPDVLLPQYTGSLLEQQDRFLAHHKPVYIKPHGAWYNLIAHEPARVEYERDYAIAWMQLGMAFYQHVIHSGIAGMMIKGSALLEEPRKANLAMIEEGFADRAYRGDGSLVPRYEPGAVLSSREEIASNVRKLAPEVDSICVHGDTPGCVAIAALVRKTLVDEGFEVGY